MRFFKFTGFFLMRLSLNVNCLFTCSLPALVLPRRIISCMNIICRSFLLIGSLLLASLHAIAAENVPPLSALGKLPVRELTVFKDGHVFVAHQGTMPVDGDGNVAMDYLPTPVIG